MAVTTCAQQILKNADGLGSTMPVEFWDLMERYRGALISQSYAMLGDLADAEDAVQETLCEAFRRSKELGEVRSISAWLRALNKANTLDRLRDRRRNAARKERKRLDPAARMLTSGGFSVVAVRESVARAIEALPEALRDVVVLHYWEHLSHDQIAARQGISSRTVSRQLHDAYLLLHGNLISYLTSGVAEGGKEDGP